MLALKPGGFLGNKKNSILYITYTVDYSLVYHKKENFKTAKCT